MAGNASSAPRPWRCCRRDRLTIGAVIAAAAIWTIAVFFSAPTLAAATAVAATLETGVKSLTQREYAGRSGPRAHGLTAPAGGVAVQFGHGAVQLDPAYTPAPPDGAGHILLQLKGPLTAAQEQRLRDIGVTLLEYIPAHTWKARVASSALAALRSLDFVYALGDLYPVDKVPPAVLANDFNSRSLNSDGSLTLEIYFHPTVTYARAAAVLAELRATPQQSDFLSGQRLTVRVPQAQVLALLRRDEVAWVEDREAPKAGSNVSAAALSHIDSLTQAPDRLSGAGVVVGMWDEGLVDVTHPDLAAHVIQGEAGQVVGHSTHVAGTIAGSGAGNASARGMAPAASVRSYDFYGDPVAEQTAARSAHGMVLSNNSWGYLAGWQTNYYGDGYWVWFGGANSKTDPDLGSYAAASRDWDRLIHDSGLVVVKSAGNDRSDTGASGRAHRHYGDTSTLYYDAHDSDGDYRSIGQIATAKNVITVGAVDHAGAMTSYSAWGPTNDGRLKPDVVAEGQDVFSTYSGGTYTSLSGTSMAAPVVSGAIALLVERYRAVTGGVTPTPHLIRALLAETAVDLGNPGPDYAYGWGLMDARAALEIIDVDEGSGRRFVLDSVLDNAVRRYDLDLADGAASLKTTLAWTDPPASAGAASALVNDLDLKLIAPNGAVYYPYSLAGLRDPEARATAAGPNTVDNIEQVLVAAPMAGHWQIEVRGTQVQGTQPFALVSNQDMPVDTVPPGGTYLVINSGGRFALSYDVQLFLAGYDNLGVTGYAVSENPTPPALNQYVRTATSPQFRLALPYRFSAGEGVKTLYLWLRDAAGNVGEVARAAVEVDTLPPSPPRLGVTAGAEPGRPQWRWSSINGSGQFRYKLNDSRMDVGAIETADVSFIPGAPLSAGTHTLYLQERDEAGHWSAVSRAGIGVSAEELANLRGGIPALAPSVRAVTPTNSPFPRWTWNSLQGGGGIFRVRLDDADLSGEIETTATAFVPLAPLADGMHTLYVQDRGTDGRWTAAVAFSVMIDTAAPVTSATVGQAAGATRLVTLECNDIGAGCAATYYTLDGSEPSPQSSRYLSPIAVSTSTTLRFLSLDQAGNEESARVENYQTNSDSAAAGSGGGGGGISLGLLALIVAHAFARGRRGAR